MSLKRVTEVSEKPFYIVMFWAKQDVIGTSRDRNSAPLLSVDNASTFNSSGCVDGRKFSGRMAWRTFVFVFGR
jgi:hypothetical protein